jgi:N-acetylmuramoyl-L-alanine amidase
MKRIGILICVFSLFTLTAYSQEEAKENFPKTGYVKNDEAIVKAGDNVNFENLCGLSKSDSVKVMDRRYSWLKILLPRKAFLYINKDYVYLTSDEKGVGIVNASSVNLRAGPGTRYSIVGQVSKPEKVSIVSEDEGWYKIEPPYGATGWVHSDQITLAEEKEINISGQKTEQKKSESKLKDAAGSTIRLNADYSEPRGQGNLSITAPADQ